MDLPLPLLILVPSLMITGRFCIVPVHAPCSWAPFYFITEHLNIHMWTSEMARVHLHKDISNFEFLASVPLVFYPRLLVIKDGIPVFVGLACIKYIFNSTRSIGLLVILSL